MKWNRTTDQALRILIHLTNEPRVVPSLELSMLLNVSQKIVTQNAALMLKAGFLDFLPGIHGGYFLAKEPSTISLYDVIITMESPDLFPKRPKGDYGKDALEDMLLIIQRSVDNIVRSISIQDVASDTDASILQVQKRALNGVIAGLAGVELNLPPSTKKKKGA